MQQILKQQTDTELGLVVFKYNSIAKQYIIRCKADQITVTVPAGGKLAAAEDFFERNRAKLLLSQKKLDARWKDAPKSISIPEANALINRANAYLPDKLKELAGKHGFSFRGCKIGKSRTAWGSCSSSNKIILSFFLMTLPEELIEYVILHELCHTIHHNHSPAFWNLLDTHTDGKSMLLRKELKNYPIPTINY